MELHDTWKEFNKTKDPALKEQLVLEHLSLVKYLAGRLAVNAPPSISQEDLEGYGVIGLLDAVEKYDSRLGTEFKNYAYTRIRGSMLDEIRKQNWVPRSKWQKFHELNTIKESMQQSGITPDDDDLAERMGMDKTRVRQLAAEYSTAFPVSLDDSSGVDGEGSLSDTISDPHCPDPLNLVAERDEKKTLVEAIRALPERDQLILALYYQEELTLKEIGLVLDVTESRVCQLHAKALQKLRDRLMVSAVPAAGRRNAGRK